MFNLVYFQAGEERSAGVRYRRLGNAWRGQLPLAQCAVAADRGTDVVEATLQHNAHFFVGHRSVRTQSHHAVHIAWQWLSESPYTTYSLLGEKGAGTTKTIGIPLASDMGHTRFDGTVHTHDALLFLWYTTHLWSRPQGLLPVRLQAHGILWTELSLASTAQGNRW